MLRKFKIAIDGKEYLVEMEEVTEGGAPVAPVVNQPVAPTPAPAAPAPEPVAAPAPAPASAADAMAAPMPGTVLKILVAPGEAVQENQPILILEAMKLENEVVADRTGTVQQLFVEPGQVINAGDPLVSIA